MIQFFDGSVSNRLLIEIKKALVLCSIHFPLPSVFVVSSTIIPFRHLKVKFGPVLPLLLLFHNLYQHPSSKNTQLSYWNDLQKFEKVLRLKLLITVVLHCVSRYRTLRYRSLPSVDLSVCACCFATGSKCISLLANPYSSERLTMWSASSGDMKSGISTDI